jgi:superfamily II DNA/RNA helicase
MPPTFAELGVPEPIRNALASRGITKPFEIQAATMADALAGRDVCGRAPTGSGKTLAFGIPLVVGVGRAEPKLPRALVLAPTRELAEQITAEISTFAGSVRTAVVYGGVGYGVQLKALRHGVDILVACPGRLEDLINQGAVNLKAVDRVVLDEADRMADMGFMPAVRRLLDQTSGRRQTMLFSATLDGDVAKLTRDYQHNPVRHEVGEETPDITAASHVFWNVAKADRTAVTAETVNLVWPAIVFCRTRHGSDRLAIQLGKVGIQVARIHGGRSQSQRTQALADFANGKVSVLVASDVAARGIHVDGVAVVVHYDAPEDHKTYVHRSGRTARAGQGGVVVTLVQPEQIKDMRSVQRQIGLNGAFTNPDASALRSLSDAPARPPTPAKPIAETNVDETRSLPSGRMHAAGVNGRNDRGGRTTWDTRKGRPAGRNRKNANQTGRGRGPKDHVQAKQVPEGRL